MERLRISIQGQVQGVGFRPRVYAIAHRLSLSGWIQNNASGVLIEVQGARSAVFLTTLQNDLPPLAIVRAVTQTRIPCISDEPHFEIRASTPGAITTISAPDTATCSECLEEVHDRQSHYYGYPFLNCTQCGPRYSITKSLPYDRIHTSMDVFPLCPQCHHDYTDPKNRRYHAQPTACTRCGPKLTASIQAIATLIRQGNTVAVKGISGYQLITDARNEVAILRLRARKQRPTKPLAVLVGSIKQAQEFSELSEAAKTLLESPARPIVLVPKKKQTLPETIAPGLTQIGIMLPSTPIHHLLLHALGQQQTPVLVVTSANPQGMPLISEDTEAKERLAPIADQIISYNRDIITRSDDSVLRIIDGAPLFIRRARGYVPSPIPLAKAIPPTLALGGHLKNTFCITRGDEAFMSQHIGSLTNSATRDFFHDTLSHLLRFLDVTPERIAHDLHPDFYTSQLITQYSAPQYAIQHHHAHLGAVVAEYQIQRPILGLALDGYGYGLDGEAWGGELCLLDTASCTRLGHCAPIPQPGGARAAQEPWRMAAGVVHQLGKGHTIASRFSEHPHSASIQQLLDKNINCPGTSSCGRLFDAASALLGVCSISSYEGEAAMRLESLVTTPFSMNKGWLIQDGVLDMRPTLLALLDEKDAVLGANLFHGTLIAGLSEWIRLACQEHAIDTVALSGGCFLNKILAEGVINALSTYNIHALLPRMAPPNDGGLSLGQAWIAGIS